MKLSIMQLHFFKFRGDFLKILLSGIAREIYYMNKAKSIEELIDTSEIVKSLDHLPGIFAYKTIKHEILYCNEKFLKYTGHAHIKSLEGRTDHDLIWHEYADIYHQQEDETLNGSQYSSIHPGIDVNSRSFLVFNRKYPWFDEEKNIKGIISYSIEIDDARLINVGQLLNKLNFNVNKKVYFLNKEKEVFSLSAREKECLFYLLHGKTAKQTGKVLSISPRTVQIHLGHVKNKLGCQNKSELIEFAVHKGLVSVVPDNLFSLEMEGVLED